MSHIFTQLSEALVENKIKSSNLGIKIDSLWYFCCKYVYYSWEKLLPVLLLFDAKNAL